MPLYQVVRCAGDACGVFQTQQAKKATKWTCVMCGLRQSILRVHFESEYPKDCRIAVQRLNEERGALLEEVERAKEEGLLDEQSEYNADSDDNDAVLPKKEQGGRWARFLQQPDVEPDAEPDHSTIAKVSRDAQRYDSRAVQRHDDEQELPAAKRARPDAEPAAAPKTESVFDKWLSRALD